MHYQEIINNFTLKFLRGGKKGKEKLGLLYNGYVRDKEFFRLVWDLVKHRL